MQLTDSWEERYRNSSTAWEDEETAPSTKQLLLTHLPRGCSVLEIGCGRGVDSVWLAAQGYRVVACDISQTAVDYAKERARQYDLTVDFRVADVLQDHGTLPHCDAVFERGVLHTFVTDEGRARFAAMVADLLEGGHLWLSVAGIAATRAEAESAAKRQEARISASQIADAVEPNFDILSMMRTRYGFPGSATDFDAFASVFRKRG